jgi:hypothetical protein
MLMPLLPGLGRAFSFPAARLHPVPARSENTYPVLFLCDSLDKGFDDN